MKYQLEKSRHSTYQLTYHIVWCVKYRPNVLSVKIGDRLKEVLTELIIESGCSVLALETDFDHVHMLIRAKPKHCISSLVNSYKGVSARKLFLEFPGIKNRLWGGHLWSPAYFVVTVGGAPIEAVKRYVESQREK